MATEELRERLARVRLVALDVDGTLTDGGLVYGPDGVHQRFGARDGAAVMELIDAGMPVALVSFRDFPATRRRARDLGIELLCLGAAAKDDALRDLCGLLGIAPDEALFMGDGRLDLPAMLMAGVSACPADAHPEVMEACDIVAEAPGGRGAVAEVIGMLP